jgi:hypothetical protein
MNKIAVSLLLIISNTLVISQNYDFDNQWMQLGPNEKPQEDGRQSANGIGPVEFIKANQKVKDLLLAGALNGGLFVSKDGGAQWMNAGSDDWPYSACSWAEFHPDDENTWFAASNLDGDNNSAGLIGNQGGIYRTMDGGLNWEMVGDKSAFINSKWMRIYGFQFHPEKSDNLIVYTSNGLFESKNCRAETVVWERVADVKGNVFDLEFIGDDVFYSEEIGGKWNVIQSPSNDLSKKQEIAFVGALNDPIDGLTLENRLGNPLILVNYSKKGDELWEYNPVKKTAEKILKNLRVVFGVGRAFAISPHNPNEVLIGYSIQLKRYDLIKRRSSSLKSGYHVDVENVCYDPFDTSRVYIATHGGVYLTTDNFNSWKSHSKGLGVAEVQGIAVSNSNPEIIAIGCYHDGSSLRADFNNNREYQWKNINGGDGLIPLLPSDSSGFVYTSNQYTGGGMFMSKDWGRDKRNLHSYNKVQTSGWMMAAVLHPENEQMIFFNYVNPSGEGKGNMDVGRTVDPLEKDSLNHITDFQRTHQIEKYAIYGLYNSPYYPDHLYLHMIHMTTNEDEKPINVHRLFKTEDCTAPEEEVINSWYELELPRSDWISNITPDPSKSNRLYVSFVQGIYGTEDTENDFGLIYQLKLSKKNVLKREADITNNIPFSHTGRYNLVADGNGGMFYGTRNGIYYGTKKTLKGRRDWVKIGFGTPHCKVHGLHFDKKTNTLTVGYFGRGVWRYYL